MILYTVILECLNNLVHCNFGVFVMILYPAMLSSVCYDLVHCNSEVCLL